MPERLQTRTLSKLPSTVAVPRYARERLSAGIVHIGLGNFTRAHQALYLDDLFARGEGHGWAICGVGLLPADARMADALRPQDHLYTLVERDRAGESVRVVGSVVDCRHAPSDPEGVLARLADPATRIVTLTVTEGGYYLDQSNGALDAQHPNLRHDLEHRDDAPASVWGYLASALDRRRRAGGKPFTLQSCDNLQGNGDVAKRMLASFARLRDPQLGAWIEANVAFPNSMVDRITPATSDELRAHVRDVLGGIEDAWPVMGETFRQWVIEDHFVDGRPAFEHVGAQMTADVHPYELMKIHMLNASHQAFCHLGVVLGYETADEAMRDPEIVRLLGRYMDGVRPLLVQPPGEDLERYQRTLLERFSNPAIRDQLARICFDASSRIPKFVLPMAAEQLRRGGPVDLFGFVVACWMRYLGGRDEAGRSIEVKDPLADLLLANVRYGETDPTSFLSLRAVFGPELSGSKPFADAVRRGLQSLYGRGAREALREYATG
ncbi:MAG TPA: mannitol dehydrogenase family protein [Nevskiaceae bacterium]|nr:mannitol dehydrogenase family protein [Nevskiaceae bacterium]